MSFLSSSSSDFPDGVHGRRLKAKKNRDELPWSHLFLVGLNVKEEVARSFTVKGEMNKPKDNRIQVDYLLSLPERSIRALASLVGGASVFLADTLLPDALQGTTIYKILIGDTQRFLIERMAQMEQQFSSKASGDIPKDFMQRKAAGTILEAAGLLAFHFSPMWVLAIAGDASAGSKVFFERLIEHLKEQGVIPEDSNIDNLVDLIEATQTASQVSVKGVDTPPLSRSDLEAFIKELSNAYGEVFLQIPELMKNFEGLWARMEAVSTREGISMAELSGIMTIQAANWGKKSVGTVLAIGKTGSQLFGEKILQSYKETLDLVSKHGAKHYLKQYMAPFVDKSLEHFEQGRETWIEKKLKERKRNSDPDGQAS